MASSKSAFACLSGCAAPAGSSVFQVGVQQANLAVERRRVLPQPEATVASPNSPIDDALSFALEAADPSVQEGFTVREDYWGGELPAKQTKAIVHQLFRGNEYRFWMGTATKAAKISIHIYDTNGNLAETAAFDSSKKPHMAEARVIPKKTGSYYLLVEVEKSAKPLTPWALTYGFR